MDVKSYAAKEGISERRVRQLIQSGALKAAKIGGKWVIQDIDRVKRSRPRLSARQRQDLVSYLSDPPTFLSQVHGYRKPRTLEYVHQLETSEQPEQLIIEWFDGFLPPGNGPAATIREVIRGSKKWGALGLKHHIKPKPVVSKERVRARVVSARLKMGRSLREAAEFTGLPVEVIRRMEQTGTVPGGVPMLRKYLAHYGDHPSVIEVPNLRRDEHAEASRSSVRAVRRLL
ncbi:MAG: helix-turn-helix domain-containing protein [Leucobacter sp.]|nr:helix-turn-helix domain-containing protein [Leucobacter sp.]